MAGTTGYITKPFGPETLMKTVESYILQKDETTGEAKVSSENLAVSRLSPKKSND
jgi:DNA-binding response OmpR family regulator